MRPHAIAVAVAGLAVTIAAEAATYLPEEPRLAAGDALVGLAFLGLGLVAWQRRPSSRSGLLMVATGFAWFAGSFASAALSCIAGRWSTCWSAIRRAGCGRGWSS
jgi:hypothetical protein